MRRWRLAHAVLIALPLLGAVPGGAVAVEPDEMLADPALEVRARALSKGLRCLVCQNESIDTSNAGLARDLRILVRERLVAGDSDAEVKAYLVARYGDFVLLKPPVKPRTYILWFGPALIVLLGAAGIAVYFRRRRRAVEDPARSTPLSPEEEARLARLLDAAAPSPRGEPH